MKSIFYKLSVVIVVGKIKDVNYICYNVKKKNELVLHCLSLFERCDSIKDIKRGIKSQKTL